jgi:hypothetical protein
VERSEWVAANAVEREMADALNGGDGPAYARLLTSAPLFIPNVPEPGTEAAQQVADLLPPGTPFVLAYTSPETLAWAMGEHAQGYQRLDFDELRQRWPDSRHQLAINPGSPIGVFLPLPTIPELAAGKTSLVSVGAFQDALMEELPAVIRAACLRELSGVDQPGDAGEHPPANQLETELRRAIAGKDSDRYLDALLGADVVLLTSAPVADPELIYEDEFPWRIVAGEQAPSITLFSSAEQLRRTVSGPAHWVQVPFFDVLANWPAEEYALCVNPGGAGELILPPPAVDELLSAFDSVVQQQLSDRQR